MNRCAVFMFALLFNVAFSAPIYEWCDPTTGTLRAGHQPPNGVAFWLETERPKPIIKNGHPQPLCSPAATGGANTTAPQSAQAAAEAAAQARQKRSMEALESLTRQTYHYQEGSLEHYGESDTSYAGSSSPLVIGGGADRLDSASGRTGYTPTYDPDKTVHVRGYTRKDGTYVNPYLRSPPSR